MERSCASVRVFVDETYFDTRHNLDLERTMKG